MKKIIIAACFLFLGSTGVYAAEEPEQLHAQSAVLMDADSGRVLFEKNGDEKRAMASTTKIMTCIVTLENSRTDEVVTISKNAAGQPKVRLGIRENETFYLKDLLYSLMLESHNDAAVAIAEHVGGSVEGFARMMNAKAKEIGLTNTYFITPNGLDASDDAGVHSTTARELALIMRYCLKTSPKTEVFLEITQTKSHSFSDTEKKNSYICNNHNAFLTMMEGAVSGKTGFTNDAGYCYVGALENNGRTYIVALLACGWPNNKNYKWSDTRTLMSYGLQNYRKQDLFQRSETKEKQKLPVKNGIAASNQLFDESYAEVMTDCRGEKALNVLLRDDERIEVIYKLPEELKAPVEKGEQVGEVQFMLEGETLRTYPLKAKREIREIDFRWCFEKLLERYIK